MLTSKLTHIENHFFCKMFKTKVMYKIIEVYLIQN